MDSNPQITDNHPGKIPAADDQIPVASHSGILLQRNDGIRPRHQCAKDILQPLTTFLRCASARLAGAPE